ncbi:sulfite exporter TauE/SafE family protein 3-like [Amaranthus tricolor]|uniref:sulfite exporter TauE/SafE family protein 3-like n=1 Tax=Amaranthus tricolor TaxID=29722 RepID=UPI0025866799|nr:sulfite exporter TauE/SafE family protein 3-like [Amaranthus tricolor]
MVIMVSWLPKWKLLRSILMASLSFLLASVLVSAGRTLNSLNNPTFASSNHLLSQFVYFLWRPDESGYHHVWPEIKFGWQIVLGSFIGFCGAAFGSVGGVGGGGIFVPMLSLIIGFDPKSATAISKCMITGAAASTVYYNLKLRHPTLDMPIIDYDLALLFQPMLMLGVSIGVAFNVIFADWMVTVLLLILFVGTSIKALLKGIETWRKETLMKQEALRQYASNGTNGEAVEYKALPSRPNKGKDADSVINNVRWKELGLLVFVWAAFLVLQIFKEKTATCSTTYWVLNLMQIPVAVGVSSSQAFSLYKGHRIISSKGDVTTNWKVHQLVLYCCCGVSAGIVGGLLGLGGGFILGPLFLELGIPPQVSSATATFAMAFSASMSVIEYYLLKRFPIPFALYFIAVATFAAIVGQHAVRKLIIILGRASIIIFILSFTIFVSAVSLGGVGISNMIGSIQRHEYMGFENLCKYKK